MLDNDPESLAFGEARGFVEERRELGVVLHLSEIDPPPVEPPDGVQIVTWAQRPELARGMYEVGCEALPDIPGAEEDAVEPFEDWLAHEMQGSGDRPDATFVAVAGDEVVGYAKFSFTAAQPTTAHHDLSGVKRAWRGRGIARALKAAQINWALANGYRELHTRNEQRNEPIRRLNAQFGYRPSVGRMYLVGPVATPNSGKKQGPGIQILAQDGCSTWKAYLSLLGDLSGRKDPVKVYAVVEPTPSDSSRVRTHCEP